MKAYGDYKNSGVDWLGRIPTHWTVKKLKFVSDCLNTIRVPLNSEERGSMLDKVYDYYGASGVIDKVETYLFNENLILIGEDGANLLTRSKRLAFIAKGKYWVNNHAHILRPKNGDIRYLCEMLELIDYSIYVSGSAQPKLTQEALLSIEVVEPPLQEQTQIAQYLDHKTSQIDKLITDKEKLIELLNEERTAIINQAVTKGLSPDVPMKDSGIEWLGEVPKHWEKSKIKYIADIVGRIGFRGYTVQDLVEKGEGAISLSPSNIKDHLLNFDECTYLSWQKYEESPEIKIYENDIVVVKTGSTIGKIAIVPATQLKVTLNPQLVVLKRVKLVPRFLYYLMTSVYFQSYFKIYTAGGSTPAISQEKINNFEIAFPNEGEQFLIAEYIDSTVVKFDGIIIKLRQEIQLLKEYKTALISEVVTGKVDVRDEVIAESTELVS